MCCLAWQCQHTVGGGESNPKGQTSLRCRLTQTAACLVGPARLLRASGA